MGLDMYLNAEYFIWEYGEAEQNAANIRAAIAGVMPVIPGKVEKIVTEAAYWRKANAIHQWFVDNVQDGVDECQKSYVTRDHLKALIKVCEEVLADPEKGNDLLPTQGGFFFGSTDYDEGYIEDLKSTIEQLTPLLDEEKFPPSDWEFYYQSSW